MSRHVNLAQPLLHETRHPSPATGNAHDITPRASEVPPLSQWTVFKFVMLTPMSGSPLTSFLLVFFGAGSSVGTGVALAYVAKYTVQLIQSILKKDIHQYEEAFSQFIVVIAAMVVTQGVSTYCMKRIGLVKRIHLNRTLHLNYFGSKKFYLLNTFHSDHCDNADSRLTSDIETMTSELYSILQVVVYCLTAFIYGLVLVVLNDATLALIGLACLSLFSLIVYGVLQYVSKRVSSRVSELKRDEGFFSFQHTRIKKNCESIAFYSGQCLELQKIKLMFESVLRSARKVIKGQMILDFFTMIYSSAVVSNFPVWIGKHPFCPTPLLLLLLIAPFLPLTPFLLPIRLCVLPVDQHLEFIS